MNSSVAICIRLMASVALLATAACGQITIPEKILSAEGTIFVSLVSHRFVPLPGVATNAQPARRLLRSSDGGKTWLAAEVGGLQDFLFLTPQEGFLVIGGSLYSTNDGAASRVPLPDAGTDIYKIRKSGPVLIASAEKRISLSLDRGRSWKNRKLPPMGNRDRVGSAAWGEGVLALATSRGRVYVESSEEESWSEWIVGNVQDLTYFEDRFYALTSMATVAVLDGETVEHLALGGEETYPIRFAHFDGLYFSTDLAVYKIEGRELRQVAKFSDAGLPGNPVRGIVELVSPYQAVAYLWGQQGVTSGLRRIQFDTMATEELSPFP